MFRYMSRNALDLVGIEDRVDAMKRPPRHLVGGFVARRSVLPLRVAGFTAELPKFDVCALLTLPNLPAVLLRLAVGQPPRILIAFLQRDRHEVKGIPSAIGPCGVGIEWKFKRFFRVPRFLPRGRALFEHLNDGIGDFLSEIPLESGCLFSHWICLPVQNWPRGVHVRSPNAPRSRRPTHELFAGRPRLPKL